MTNIKSEPIAEHFFPYLVEYDWWAVGCFGSNKCIVFANNKEEARAKAREMINKKMEKDYEDLSLNICVKETYI